MYQVTLKPGHPRGVFRRGDREFTREPVLLTEEEMTEAIMDEPLLDVVVVEDAEPTWPTDHLELVKHIVGLEGIAEIEIIAEWEKQNRGRKTVLEAAEARLAELAEPEDGDDA